MKKRKRVCQNKVRHAAFEGAVISIKKMEKKQFYIHKRVAYKCKYCKGWHVGRINRIHPKVNERLQKLLAD